MTAMTYTVVWDGTKGSASGTKYLAAAEPAGPDPSAQARPVSPYEWVRPVTILDAVYDLIVAMGPTTAREIVNRMPRVRSQTIYQCCHRLERTGRVRVVRFVNMRRVIAAVEP